MAEMKQALATFGVPLERIHVEIFSGGELVSVIAVRAVWFRGRSPMDRSRSISPPKATSSSAAHDRCAMWSSICYEFGPSSCSSR